MRRFMAMNGRLFSVAGFSFLFAYILSFLFEGQVLYSLLGLSETGATGYILVTIVAHFAGLFSCGYLVHSPISAKYIMLGGMCVCITATAPFFFAPSPLWAAGLIVSGYVSGCAVASWGYFLKVFTSKNQRIKSCADVLIYSNIIMIAINVVAIHLSPFIGLALSMFCLVAGVAFIWVLPVDTRKIWREETESKPHGDIKKPLMLLCLFVFVITINSGLMYQVINPAFEHLTGIVSWYWAVPYIIALAVMRNLPMKANRSIILYVGMAMIMGAFISFMLLGRRTSDYLVVDTLMLGACGIFDLFWWSIIGEMLDYTENPVKVFGIGLSANVFGVLCGDVIGMAVTSIQLPGAEVAVMALTVVCVTLVMLPLNCPRPLFKIVNTPLSTTICANSAATSPFPILPPMRLPRAAVNQESSLIGKGKIPEIAKTFTSSQIPVSAITIANRFLSPSVRLKPPISPLNPLFSTGNRPSPLKSAGRGVNSSGNASSPAAP